MKNRTGETKINEVVDKIMSQYGLTTRMREMRVVNNWSDFVGNDIAEATIRVDIYNRVIFLKLNSAAVSNNIAMTKSQVIQHINELSGCNLVDDIVVI